MTFKQFYTERVAQIVSEKSSTKENQIFVFLGQGDLLDVSSLGDLVCDIDTFKLNGNEELFDRNWFAKVFSKLNTERKFHFLSFAQFSYIIHYIDSSFFRERILVIKDNLRQLFPIGEHEFLEESSDENIDIRPSKIPIYQAEQIQIGENYYYSVKSLVETYDSVDIFNEKKELEEKVDTNLESIDINSDQIGLDHFVNECVLQDNFKRYGVVKIYAKQPISSGIIENVQRINFVLNFFGGAIYLIHEEALTDNYKVKDSSRELLLKYWGPSAEFRGLMIYRNPDKGNENHEISQGLIVDTVIDEYENSKKNVKTRDLFLTAPTGAGKSLLFQLPAFYVSQCGDMSIVISPLIALMKDQVNAIITERRFEKVAYLNSELSLVDREKVIDNCKSGEFDVLYMSPELFMSYDIKHFIGERKLGLLVIDEAHLITTWGRDFRVDYWFLGNHVRKIRKYHNLKFPMVAVTATAIYGGSNDMVFDSIDSLVMHDPHIFIGRVKRSDITFAINNHDEFAANYESQKLAQTVGFIKEINTVGLKALIYAPYTSHIRKILNTLEGEGLDIAAGYFGTMPADQKEFAFRQFKNGEKKIMISTKAFGMGVDISDIELVYHHAPSGLLPDYVQEIGRVARKTEILGFAALNYSSQDQRFTKALHGMSALRQYQIKEVLKKIHMTYVKNNKSRNLLLSVDDFGHIFEDALDLDQKVLTALMMIEKDYLAKTRFNVLIARPKKLFVRVFARISDLHLDKYRLKYGNSFSLITSLANGHNIVEIDLDKLWYQNFKDKSFPLVKRDFYTGFLFKNEGIEVIPQLKISFERLFSLDHIYRKLTRLLDGLKGIFNNFSGGFFSQRDLESAIFDFIGNASKAEKLSAFVLSSFSGRLIQPGVIEPNAFLQKRREIDGERYRVFNNQYLPSFNALTSKLNNLFGETEGSTVTRYVTNKEMNSVHYTRLGYFLEILELAVFEIKGGENPMVFIRLNDPSRVDRDSRSSNYTNTLLSKTLERHHLSNQIFDHFFLRTFTNDERWDFIEDFFLGSDIDVLLNNYGGGAANKLNIVDFLKNNAIPLNVPIAGLGESNNLHIFPPNPETYYRNSNMLTITTEKGSRTMKVSQWLAEDTVAFDIVRKQHELKIDKTVFDIMVSKLRANHHEYFRDSLGLKMKIDYYGKNKLVEANVPYKNEPLKFYKWWCKNENSIKMSFKEKIYLFSKVHESEPDLLKLEHKKILNE
jgi:RecQ family ATP-dependent DNA helicase